jgi:hypothetical protein
MHSTFKFPVLILLTLNYNNFSNRLLLVTQPWGSHRVTSALHTLNNHPILRHTMPESKHSALVNSCIRTSTRLVVVLLYAVRQKFINRNHIVFVIQQLFISIVTYIDNASNGVSVVCYRENCFPECQSFRLLMIKWSINTLPFPTHTVTLSNK